MLGADLKLNDEQDILRLVSGDEWMMDVLRSAARLALPDWWMCAGFVRSKLWDALHGYAERTPLPDVDVVYFDPDDLNEQTEKNHERRLKELMQGVPWSVKNEARMHIVNRIPPYTSAVDAIYRFPETATALGLKLDEQGELLLAAPCGVSDALRMQVKPSPHFLDTKELLPVYERRLREKNWPALWPKVQLFSVSGGQLKSYNPRLGQA